jgi:hypothetical protein
LAAAPLTLRFTLGQVLGAVAQALNDVLEKVGKLLTPILGSRRGAEGDRGAE